MKTLAATRCLGIRWAAPAALALAASTAPGGRGAPTASGVAPASGYFEENHGQTDARVRFLSRGRSSALYLTPSEAVLAIAPPSAGGPSPVAGGIPEANAPSVLRLRLAGANPDAKMRGTDALPGRSHYLIGADPRRWHTDVPHYGAVRYQEVYRGIDLVFHDGDRRDAARFEYDFVLAPGARPEDIRIRFE